MRVWRWRDCAVVDPVLTLCPRLSDEKESPPCHFQVFRSMSRAGIEPATLGLKVRLD
jgi:hypothetical protein